MTLPDRIKQQAQGRRHHADVVRPELASRAERIWLIMEPGLKNFAPSKLGLLRDYLVAKLTEYRAIQELEVLKAEQERALKERRTK